MTSNKITHDFNNVGQVMVTTQDLPLSCPMPHMALWDAHPRVYLPIEATGEAICPYCSAQYQLQRNEVSFETNAHNRTSMGGRYGDGPIPVQSPKTIKP